MNFTAIFLIFALFYNSDIPKIKQVLYFTIISTTMLLTHIAEDVIMAGIVSLYYLLQKEKDGAVKNLVMGMILGNFIALLGFIGIYMSKYLDKFSFRDEIKIALLIPS